MVKLEELEDEHFMNKPETTSGEALLVDDDEDYTDTDSEISDDGSEPELDESLLDRLSALRDIVPPKARAKISSVTSSLYSATSTTVNYSGKGLWVLATSILLLGIPYALALGDEQQFIEEEKQRQMMAEGAQGMIQPADQQAGGQARPAL
ncbi:mitochondrial import receptor subunit Tom22 [Exophiala xenobiotica]|uniref:Mitochondrial import receptor subunit Tom22 n=1 Tax=Vermiconidia calcicola TaxID=1690605 RepID=A0AAV9QBV9_9PEZI|nr:mitochondrial import receptor subunit Tom22 [Exophiala xenobiotica]KAK5540104.1 mitochondrial import receptor subunit Tom22 [Vermiconidia calcicola]KAK5543195.1 mitochondrial import receptor subunit Tom22 [Chaetothyriales sp. CCFEE 6169]KAK5213945.1 mitochondrial import receptor subunit Tom22 [Exophiala xenobiotica]KAK5224475.1 mitochondrial import receptor subunit Tom22 [Exophiala xenobiotica]